MTRFVRTTWLLSANRRLDLPDQFISIRRISEVESVEMAAQARRRNVFARHSWENSFYLQRIGMLSDATVVEVFGPGSIDEMTPRARQTAELAEKIAVVSSTLGLVRKRAHNLLAISGHRRFGFDLAISPGFKFLRSSARQERRPRGIVVDETFVRRFIRCGFPSLVQAVGSAREVGKRLTVGVNWLFESRMEPAIEAAAVKSAIALESLLILNDSESLGRSLSERSAFILSDDPAVRRSVAKAIKRFYDVRSGIVHGGQGTRVPFSSNLLEGMDRIVLLLLLTVASNTALWASLEAVASWVNDQKWGASGPQVLRPFPVSNLTRAVQLATRA